MKNLTKRVFILFFIALLSAFIVRGQDLSHLNEIAHYTLQETAVDRLGNLEDIELTNAPFDGEEGVYSFGGYLFDVVDEDSSRVRVPTVEALLDSSFAIQLEFKLDTLEERNRPLLVIGDSWRYLGLVKRPDHSLHAMHNDRLYDTNAAVLEANQWYEITIMYTQKDSLASYYLDGTLVYTREGVLQRPETDLAVSNTHGGQGNAFRGHWRNLRIYGSDMITAEETLPRVSAIHVYPNPASEWIQVSVPHSVYNELEYTIFDATGMSIKSSYGTENTLSLRGLPSGIYWLRIVEQDKIIHMEKIVLTR